ncbi:hypothetical protein CXB51_004857 [Gossypium anomalum]|uniref:Uncharacterized protein n=1 Tax=Gossypium anomalum TaxID=47600 RepID=A0A8J5ZW08_9ROSI|nr:hypothetical protein CXB51_004857 [Gossypium anomalum]
MGIFIGVEVALAMTVEMILNGINCFHPYFCFIGVVRVHIPREKNFMPDWLVKHSLSLSGDMCLFDRPQ